MDVATEELCLHKIGEFVYDEDKIVTATWLSKNLNIGIQDCKVLLKKFVRGHHSLNKDELVVSYVLCGQLKDVDKFGVLLAKDMELNSRRALFKKISSESICTVQKGKQLDLNIVGLEYARELDNPGEKPLFGCIIDENCIKRDVPKKTSNPVIKDDARTKQNLFANANVSKQPQSNGIQMNNTKDTTKPQTLPKTPLNTIGSYFSNAQNESVKKNKTEEIQLTKEETTDSYLVNEQKRNKPWDDVTEEPQPKKPKRTQNKTKNSSDNIFENAGDSEGEMNMKNNSEEEENSRPVLEIEMDTPSNKRLKLLNQTYMDESGYILTKKEWVCVSDDENDNEKVQKPDKDHKEPPIENETKMNKPKGIMKKTSTTADGETASTTKNKGKKSKKAINQPTLLNFFKSK